MNETVASSPLANRQPLRGLNINTAQEPQANLPAEQSRSGSQKPDMSNYVYESFRQRDSLEAGQRRRLASGGTPRAGSRSATPVRADATSDSSPSKNSSSSPFAGRRMDRLGRGNTLKAGFTPIPRRASPLRNVEDSTERQSNSGGAPSEVSSNDLMHPVHGGLSGNTSFPGLGAADDAPPSGARVEDNALIDYLHKMNGQLSAENAEMKEKMDSWQKQLNHALRQNELLKREAAAPRDLAEKGSAEVDGLKAKIQELESLVKDQTDEIGDLEHDKQSFEKKLEDAEARIQQLENRTRSDREDGTAVQDLHDDIDDLHDENAKLQTEVDDLQQERAQLKQQLSDEQRLHQESIDKLRAHVTERVEAAERDAREAEQRSAQLEDQLRKLEEEAQETADRTPTTNANSVASKGSRQQDSEEEESLRAELERKEFELRDAAATLDAMDETLELRAKRIQELENENELLRLDVAALQEEQQKLDSDLASADRDYNALAADRDEMHAKVEELQHIVNNLQSELQEQASNGSVSSERKANGQGDGTQVLRHALQEAQAELDQLRHAADNDAQKHTALKEKENSMLRERIQDLDGRVRSLQQYNATAEKSIMAIGTAVAQTPIRTPRSPPELSELSAMSWLNHDSTFGGVSVIRQLHAVQRELDAKNADVDEKIDRLEAHRLACMKLHENLAAAESERDGFRSELDHLWSSDGPIEQARRSLKHVRCPGCSVKFNAASKLSQLQKKGERQEHFGISVANQSATFAYESVEAKLQEVEGRWASERQAWLAEKDHLRMENDLMRAEAHRREEQELSEVR